MQYFVESYIGAMANKNPSGAGADSAAADSADAGSAGRLVLVDDNNSSKDGENDDNDSSDDENDDNDSSDDENDDNDSSDDENDDNDSSDDENDDNDSSDEDENNEIGSDAILIRNTAKHYNEDEDKIDDDFKLSTEDTEYNNNHTPSLVSESDYSKIYFEHPHAFDHNADHDSNHIHHDNNYDSDHSHNINHMRNEFRHVGSSGPSCSTATDAEFLTVINEALDYFEKHFLRALDEVFVYL